MEKCNDLFAGCPAGNSRIGWCFIFDAGRDAIASGAVKIDQTFAVFVEIIWAKGPRDLRRKFFSIDHNSLTFVTKAYKNKANFGIVYKSANAGMHI